jgi:protein-S-isoprenylcysteine O-methyltransferase Ste14
MRIQTKIVGTGWIAWLGAITLHGLRQPNRKPVISAVGPSRAGFLLQSSAAVIPWLFRHPPSKARDAAAMALVPVSVAFGSAAVRALDKQWRIAAALIQDHELIRRGAYGVVRHPVYLSFFGMTLAGALVASGWRGTLLSIAFFVAGTEIRVHAEEGLLAERFGEDFARYRMRVPAYLPFIN